MPETNSQNATANTEIITTSLTYSHTSQPVKPQFEIGSYVTFGRYPQNNGETFEPIEWLVLDKDGNTALLLSKYGLDCKQFHHELKGRMINAKHLTFKHWIKHHKKVTWCNCDLRKWLNSEFLNRAFTADEQRQIAESTIFTGDNPKYGTKGCGETKDFVFCLSIEEAWKYFSNVKENLGCTERWHSDMFDADWWINRARACKATQYAIKNGAAVGIDGAILYDTYFHSKPTEWWSDNCWYWLRSPGNFYTYAAYVIDYGGVISRGTDSDDKRKSVRPALRIKIL